MSDQAPGWTPYNAMWNHPIKYVDPDGRWAGEYELDENNQWVKTSTLGDDIGVDFYHWDAADGTQTTYVTDRQGNWNTINNGRQHLQGTQRGSNINWETIYNEWQKGHGPEKSIFVGNHSSNQSIKEHYLYQDALEQFENSGLSKSLHVVNFGLLDIVRSGDNMQAQMMGSYNVSFYRLGDRTLALALDSKSRQSFFYGLPMRNYNRGSRWESDGGSGVIFNDRRSTTYQRYLFFN